MAHPGGRPRKKIEDIFPPNWKDIIFQMASEGCSDVQIEAHFLKINGISACAIEAMWKKLREREVEFNTTLKIARKLCQAWWEAKGKENLKHSKEAVFETALWFINMKNRFGWQDKTEINHGISDNLMEKFSALSTEQLKGKVNELLGNKS